MNREEYKNFVIRWDNMFPIDRWYRNKHKIPFLSEEHKECDFFAELMEFEEDKVFYELQQEKEEKEKQEYIPNIGDWLKAPEGGISEQDTAFYEDQMFKMIEFEQKAKEIKENGERGEKA